MKYLFIVLFILLVFFSSSKIDSIEGSKLIVNNDINGLDEAKAYKMLYENQLKSNDAILKTIFYALGGLGSAILLVFGSTWWFNDKKVKDAMNEIDEKIEGIKKDALSVLTEKINILSAEKTEALTQAQFKLQKEITSTISEMINQINKLSNEKLSDLNQTQIKLQEEVTANNTYLNNNFNLFVEKIRAEIKEDNIGLVNNYQSLVKSYNDNLSLQLKTIQISFEEKIKTLSMQIEENKKYNNEFRKEIRYIKLDVLTHEADIAFLSKNNPIIALQSYLKIALFERDSKMEWRFKYTSDDIIKCLEKMTFIYKDYGLDELNTVIDYYEEQYPDKIKRIRTLVAEKPIRNLAV